MIDDDDDDAGATTLVDVVRDRLAAGKPVRRTLDGGGRLHIDRPLPFLCVYRAPADKSDPGTADLVRTQASYVIASAAAERHAALVGLVRGVVETLIASCAACLVLELWAGDCATGCFRIHIANEDRRVTTIEALANALRAMTALPTEISVEVVVGAAASPPALPALVEPELAAGAGCLVIGLEVPPLFRSPIAVYPGVLRALSRDLTNALHQGFFEFTRVQTPARPEHYQMMGRRRLVRAVRDADQTLAEIASSFDFLLAVTPTNTEEAWAAFCRDRTTAPTLRYRLLAVDPDLARRRLYDLPLERLEDPVLALLLREKRRELDHQLGLVDDRETARFLPGSLQLYGGVDDDLIADALAILATVPASAGGGLRSGPRCDATTLAARARAQLDDYRRGYPSLAATVEIRPDISSLLVSHGDLLVPSWLDVAAGRVEALLQHEVGTHVVTYANGRSQSLQVFATGLAGYEALQEGLALFAEYVAGGLDGERMRLIAARVVAVRRLIDGASFPELVDELVGTHGIAARRAFGVAVRVFRGGGLTKDAIYLRGLQQLLAYLATGGSIEPLLVGKVAAEHVPLVEELLRREVLHAAPVRPAWLASPGADDRLARARAGMRPVDLIEPRSTS